MNMATHPLANRRSAAQWRLACHLHSFLSSRHGWEAVTNAGTV